MRELLCILLLLALHGSRGGEAYNDGAQHPKLGSSSVVKRAAGDPFSRRSAVDKNFIRFGRSMDYFHEQPGRPPKNLMSFARVSRAAKDNFMRFGRGDLDTLFLTPTAESTQNNNRRGENFMRFGRAKDNFMRFGRGKDNFMRFGRTFMRFGRSKQDNFMRFGRGDNFMRFGKSKDNFMRFGRKDRDNFMRFGRKDNFMRFGRDPDDVSYDDGTIGEVDEKSDGKHPFVRLSKAPKSQDGFIRFGRSDSTDPETPKIDDDGPEVEVGDLDLEADKAKNGPIIRIKRDAQPISLWEVEAADMKRVSRDAELMEEIPPLTAGDKRLQKEVKKRFVDPESYPESDIQWADSDAVDPLEAYNSPDIIFTEGKRTSGGGGSNFIRFG